MCSAHCYSFFMWNIIFSCWNSLGVYGPIVKGGGKVRQCNVLYEVADLLSRLTISITALADEFPHVRRVFIYKIITEKLEYHTVSTEKLTNQQKEKRMCSGRGFLGRYQQDGKHLCSHVVMSDGTWKSYTNAERKQQSVQWRPQLTAVVYGEMITKLR